jgi:hypothetical protein
MPPYQRAKANSGGRKAVRKSPAAAVAALPLGWWRTRRQRAKCSGVGRSHLERRLQNLTRVAEQRCRISVLVSGCDFARNTSETNLTKSSRRPAFTKLEAFWIICFCLSEKSIMLYPFAALISAAMKSKSFVGAFFFANEIISSALEPLAWPQARTADATFNRSCLFIIGCP